MPPPQRPPCSRPPAPRLSSSRASSPCCRGSRQPIWAGRAFSACAPSSATRPRGALAALCRSAPTELGRETILGLPPFTGEAALRAHRRRYEEAARLVGGQALV